LREVRESGEKPSGREALLPVLASLGDLRLPPGVSLAVEEEPAGAGIAVSRPGDGFRILLGHSLYRREKEASPPSGGYWTVRVERGPEDSGRGTECFDDLAACARRVHSLIVAAR
jgi:hypothetical protein